MFLETILMYKQNGLKIYLEWKPSYADKEAFKGIENML